MAHPYGNGCSLVQIPGFRILRLTEGKNTNARNVPGHTLSFWRTPKVLLRFTGHPAPLRASHIYGDSCWAACVIDAQRGVDGYTQLPVPAAYNGFVVAALPLKLKPSVIHLKVLYSEHSPNSNDQTMLMLHAGTDAFGVGTDDAIERKATCVKPLGIFLGDVSIKVHARDAAQLPAKVKTRWMAARANHLIAGGGAQVRMALQGLAQEVRLWIGEAIPEAGWLRKH